jgi:hypothetical protein
MRQEFRRIGGDTAVEALQMASARIPNSLNMSLAERRWRRRDCDSSDTEMTRVRRRKARYERCPMSKPPQKQESSNTLCDHAAPRRG